MMGADNSLILIEQRIVSSHESYQQFIKDFFPIIGMFQAIVGMVCQFIFNGIYKPLFG